MEKWQIQIVMPVIQHDDKLKKKTDDHISYPKIRFCL